MQSNKKNLIFKYWNTYPSSLNRQIKCRYYKRLGWGNSLINSVSASYNKKNYYIDYKQAKSSYSPFTNTNKLITGLLIQIELSLV